jgi:hypothetical protein
MLYLCVWSRFWTENRFTLFLEPLYIAPMRPETERAIAEIQQAIALLRRHL